MKKLKPCPFCGEKGDIVEGMNEFWVNCVQCGAATQMESNRDRAIEAWNMRWRSK